MPRDVATLLALSSASKCSKMRITVSGSNLPSTSLWPGLETMNRTWKADLSASSCTSLPSSSWWLQKSCNNHHIELCCRLCCWARPHVGTTCLLPHLHFMCSLHMHACLMYHAPRNYTGKSCKTTPGGYQALKKASAALQHAPLLQASGCRMRRPHCSCREASTFPCFQVFHAFSLQTCLQC